MCVYYRVENNNWEDNLVAGVGFLAPGTSVAKCGRSSRGTSGIVNELYLQRWVGDKVSTEIAITTDNESPFGTKGDSGSAVIIEGENQAGGILIGMLLLFHFYLL